MSSQSPGKEEEEEEEEEEENYNYEHEVRYLKSRAVPPETHSLLQAIPSRPLGLSPEPYEVAAGSTGKHTY